MQQDYKHWNVLVGKRYVCILYIWKIGSRVAVNIITHELIKQVLESSAVDWTLLVEAFFESRLYNPAMAAISGFFTEEGKENLKHVLREMIETTNCPVIIAWDNEKQKVRYGLFKRTVLRYVPDFDVQL